LKIFRFEPELQPHICGFVGTLTTVASFSCPGAEELTEDGASELAPEEGLEPSTTRLTAACSTIELLWNPKEARNLLRDFDPSTDFPFARASPALSSFVLHGAVDT
jgi:hypothetical protein